MQMIYRSCTQRTIFWRCSSRFNPGINVKNKSNNSSRCRAHVVHFFFFSIIFCSPRPVSRGAQTRGQKGLPFGVRSFVFPNVNDSARLDRSDLPERRKILQCKTATVVSSFVLLSSATRVVRSYFAWNMTLESMAAVIHYRPRS